MNWLTRLLSNRSNTSSLDAGLREALAHWHALPPPELGKSHFESRYVVLNTHSSGLNADKDHVLAVAAIALEAGALDPADSFFSPLEPDPATALTNLLTFCGGGPIVVYNSSVNRVMLERALDRHLGVAPQWLWLDLYWLLPTLFNDDIDTPTKLADWKRIFDIDTFERRHALGDAYAIAQLMLALASRALRRGMVSPRALAEAERARRQASGRG